MQLNQKALGFTVGTLAGAGWLLAMGFSLLTGIGVRTLSTIGSYHPWFSYSWNGAVMMVILHLVGGFLAGFVFATLYNKLAK